MSWISTGPNSRGSSRNRNVRDVAIGSASNWFKTAEANCSVTVPGLAEFDLESVVAGEPFSVNVAGDAES